MEFRSKFEGPWATPEDPHDVHTGSWRSQRPVTKAAKCRECGWCFIFCPSGCRKATDHSFEADLTYCKGCGVCSRECPARAIMMVREEI
ncbi:MAG: 4Fe-4S binding protein [Deltaproteobacteria bacterium]